MNKINYLISSFARANLNSHSAKILKGRSVGSETVFAPPSEKHSRSKVAILGRLAPTGKTRPFPSERRKKASHNEIVFHLTLVLCCSEWTKVSFPPTLQCSSLSRWKWIQTQITVFYLPFVSVRSLVGSSHPGCPGLPVYQPPLSFHTHTHTQIVRSWNAARSVVILRFCFYINFLFCWEIWWW